MVKNIPQLPAPADKCVDRIWVATGGPSLALIVDRGARGTGNRNNNIPSTGHMQISFVFCTVFLGYVYIGWEASGERLGIKYKCIISCQQLSFWFYTKYYNHVIRLPILLDNPILRNKVFFFKKGWYSFH